jgi:glycosyltransferase involved in cell wall biosynthesis
MLERFCLSSVDAFVTVNEPLLELYRERLPALERVPCAVVRNGFDPDDFEGPPVALPEDLASLGERCDLVFTGRFYPEVSPEQGLAAALGALGREDPEFAKSVRLFLIGPRDPSFEPDLAAAAPVTVIRRSPLPYREAIAAQRRATALVLLGGLGRFALATSLKVYEYLAAGRPLIAQASRGGELESFLRGRPGVRVAATEDGAAALVPRLRELFAAWRAGTLPPREDAGLADYSRKAQAGAMARLLDGLGRGAAAPS